MSTKSGVRFVKEVKAGMIEIQAMCLHPLDPTRTIVAGVRLPFDVTRNQEQEARNEARGMLLAKVEQAGAGVACRMLVQWAEHGGDAPAMLTACVNAARRALAMEGEWRPGE